MGDSLSYLDNFLFILNSWSLVKYTVVAAGNEME